MTIDELYKPIKDAAEHGCGDLEVYAQEFGKPRKLLPIEFVNIVSQWSSGNMTEYAEIVYKNDCSEEDIKKFNDIQIESYRNERQLVFDAWGKSNQESYRIIYDLIDALENVRSDANELISVKIAKDYLLKLKNGINYEVIVPVTKEK